MSGAEALGLARDLARQEGILCGVTGGATLAAALRVAKTSPKGSKILFMVPDTGERYLSTPLFEPIQQEMDDTEKDISNSTPLCRFGATASQRAASTVAAIAPAPARGRDFVQRVITDSEQPVVMFALEWCEFSWAVRRFLKDIGVPFRSVDLDSVALQAGDMSGDIRKAPRALTGEATIPQIFVGGTRVGGAVDVLELHDRGELMALLNGAGVTPTGVPSVAALSHLPRWLATRPAA